MPDTNLSINDDERSTAWRASPAGHDHKLDTIFQVARIMAGERNLAVMLPEFLRGLSATLPAADAGVLLLFDPAAQRLKVAASWGYEAPYVQHLQLAAGESLSGKAFQTGATLLFATPEDTVLAMADMSDENREHFQAATAGLLHPLSAICVPLKAGPDCIGVLVLENLRQPASFDRADLPFLEAVAELITLSIENVRLSQELQATLALKEANRLKEELISTLAHEMRTPLTSIKGYSTALLMDEAAFSPETQREFLQIIDEECDVLQDLIHDLLESSIIDAGLLKLVFQPTLLPRLARAAIEDLMHQSSKHQFAVDFPPDFPIVDADPQRIAQVLRNLVDNSIKYSPEGGLIVVRGEVEESEVIVSVADQGVGIAPEHLNRLFEKYFRIESGLVRHVVGSGLGLPIAHTIIESHHGRIWAESKLGEGTVFFFSLPLSNLEPGLTD
ncbi:MAG: ATP-binding protein [Caldilineales bacterium]